VRENRLSTFLDAGVLLTAWRGQPVDADAAIALMEDPQRAFVTSQLVKLELIPKAAHFKQSAELNFYNVHFDAAIGEEPLSKELGKSADKLASKYGLAAVDALHIAAAIRQGAREFITTESPSKPLYRVTEISVKSLRSVAETKAE
jgi:predicted nucleic acid-binding protein